MTKHQRHPWHTLWVTMRMFLEGVNWKPQPEYGCHHRVGGVLDGTERRLSGSIHPLLPDPQWQEQQLRVPTAPQRHTFFTTMSHTLRSWTETLSFRIHIFKNTIVETPKLCSPCVPSQACVFSEPRENSSHFGVPTGPMAVGWELPPFL